MLNINERIENTIEKLMKATSKISPRDFKNNSHNFDEVFAKLEKLTEELNDLKFIKKSIVNLVNIHHKKDMNNNLDTNITLDDEEIHILQRCVKVTKNNYEARLLFLEEYKERYIDILEDRLN